MTPEQLQKLGCGIAHSVAWWEPAVNTCGCRSPFLFYCWVLVRLSQCARCLYQLSAFWYENVQFSEMRSNSHFKHAGRGTSAKKLQE